MGMKSAQFSLSMLNTIAVAIAAAGCAPQAIAQTAVASAPAAETAKAPRKAVYIDPARFNAAQLVIPPPAEGTPRAKAEIEELHRIQTRRAPADLTRALADDKDESIFIYASVFGTGFNAAGMPATDALGKAIRNDAEVIANLAKDHFLRVRPYAVDRTIVGCPYAPDKPVKTSYPSGHAMNGYAYAVVLAQLVPSRADALLTRAGDYAEQRLVCGLHYRADIDASETLATVYARELIANPAFKPKLDAAVAELTSAGIIK